MGLEGEGEIHFEIDSLYVDFSLIHFLHNSQACGASAVVEEGIQLLKPGGTYVLVGLVHPDSPIFLQGERLIRKCLTIKGEQKNMCICAL